MSKRRTCSHEFMTRLAMEAISGRKMNEKITAEPAIHAVR
ncbi:integrase [Cyanobium sp. NS01]|nr:integrase [Cyanobium sp. NS01]